MYTTTTHTTLVYFHSGEGTNSCHVVMDCGTYVVSPPYPEVEGFGTESGHTVCHVVLVMGYMLRICLLLLTV